ncbi:hypothetical protein A3H16_01455 [Candidatus Kaiserbacteria bacterium RIFCSPLOWO2_12_FULL_53_8]|uniref:Uncharacterized protein n=2 Tax=Candidatus Kaiseribacteriota TaxID=1752734 RepID=A0A1F6CX42_9BACT|nr:MAG: hypothetical protein A2851_02145 [Candidatus Kaiserbacteria bacterium RIFCSPHIGHO2_01_FULL_53_29]OGG91376.1 MAG: hypothetical protein A3H16_01455 [Candidatus Kaiserbacteria bacterium RIFCSPLOWO2_12_FULL_53_8]
MTTMQKIALHASNACCAIISGLWLGAATEVVDTQRFVTEEHDRGALTRLVESVLGEPTRCH